MRKCDFLNAPLGSGRPLPSWNCVEIVAQRGVTNLEDLSKRVIGSVIRLGVMMSIFKFKTVIVAVSVAMVGWMANSHAAHAVVIPFYSDGGTTQRASVDCTGCLALVYTTDGTANGGVLDANNIALPTAGQYGFDTEFGELFDNDVANGGSPAAEAAWFNAIMGTNITLTDSDKTNPASDGVTYNSSAAFVIIKTGAGNTGKPLTILKNVSGGTFTFNWAGSSAGGAGLSHFTEVAAAVPIPAAGLLLIGGLGALGGLTSLRRRRQKAA